MYEALDPFLHEDIVASLNWPDEERFHRALYKIARNDDFSSDGVRNYIRVKLEAKYPKLSTALQKSIEEIAKDRASEAETVQRFMRANNL